jgi:uncharacterized Ntn-hydrolase superfamily protein
MTFSLAARCPRTGQVGVAAMTAMLGVGKLVAHARADCGAVATQAMVNPYLAYDGLDLLEQGLSARQVVDRLIAQDPGREGRQLGVVDAHGRAASHTGSLPDDWKGHRTGDGWACQGNRLAGPEVLDAAVEAFLEDEELPLVERLLAGLDAGEDRGGDTLGHRSATVLVMEREAYPLWDLRVDESDVPLEEIHARHEEFAEKLIPQIEKLIPTRDDPLGGFDYEGESHGV